MTPPKQEPTRSDTFADWQDFHLEGHTKVFDYSDKTSDHIGGGESQKFTYGRTDFPEKM